MQQNPGAQAPGYERKTCPGRVVVLGMSRGVQQGGEVHQGALVQEEEPGHDKHGHDEEDAGYSDPLITSKGKLQAPFLVFVPFLYFLFIFYSFNLFYFNIMHSMNSFTHRICVIDEKVLHAC